MRLKWYGHARFLVTTDDGANPNYPHFRTRTYKLRNIYWVDRFLGHFDNADIDFASHYEVTLDKASLPTKTRVLVVDYVR